MRDRVLFLILLFGVAGSSVYSQERRKVVLTDTLKQQAIVNKYLDRLSSLCSEYNRKKNQTTSGLFNPYYYKVMAPAVVYRSALDQVMRIRWQPQRSVPYDMRAQFPFNYRDSILLLHDELDKYLLSLYVEKPWLVSATENLLKQEGTIREDVEQEIVHEVKLTDQTEVPDFVSELDQTVPVVARKPNFWKFSGSGSLRFYQYYNSKNWYQDRTDNYYDMLAMVNLSAVYNNKQGFNWESKMDARLGFRPYPNDTKHQFKASEDQLRINTKIGYRATDHWNYTFFTEGTTQMLRHYYDNSEEVQSDFLTPLTCVVSLGMEYKWVYKKFNVTVNLSPLAYNLKYVNRGNLATAHGIEEGRKTYHKFGPFLKINYTWNLWDNISWTSRFYWFSDLSLTQIEWENTFDFKVNKYIKVQLFLYPRFDDSSLSYKSPQNGRYFMFKQWFNLGMEYSF